MQYALMRRFRRLLVPVLAGLALFISGFVSTASAQGAGNPPGFAQAQAAKDAHIDNVLAIDGVGGMGIGVGAGGDAVLVITATRPGVAGLPRRLNGVNVRVLVTGPIFANPKPSCDGPPPLHPSCKDGGGDTDSEKVDPTAEFPAPVPIGVSTGNEESCSAGTISARVTGSGNDSGKVFALSNNHVYAAENDADIGTPGADDTSSDTIHQPGRYDTNCVASGQVIGVLYDFVDIVFTTSANNEVDAAIALSDTARLGNATPSDGYGIPNSATDVAALGDLVMKYGRTTGLTKGEVVIVDWDGNIGYSSGTAKFVNQIVVYRAKGGPFLKSGDSGSLLVADDGSNTPVGLVFAGNASGKYGFANRIDNVLNALNVSIDGL